MREVLFSAFGGGGGVLVVLALISWARNAGADKATVAERWESGVNTLLTSAQARVEQLDADLSALRATAAATTAELNECQRRCRLLSTELDRALSQLETHGVDIEPFKTRLKEFPV